MRFWGLLHLVCFRPLVWVNTWFSNVRFSLLMSKGHQHFEQTGVCQVAVVFKSVPHPFQQALHTHTCTCACICACMHTEVLADRFVQRLVSSKRSLANINVWLEEYFENRNSSSVMPLPIQHLQHCGEFILTPCWHFTLTFLSFCRLCMKERNISRMSQSRSFSWVIWIVLCKSLCWLGFWK